MEEAHLEVIQLRDRSGARKYVTPAERHRFLAAAATLPPERRIFCEVLYYTGCRVGEAHRLKLGHFDPIDRLVIIETLKRRKAGIFRAIPVPSTWLKRVRQTLKIKDTSDLTKPAWTFALSTGYRTVKRAMRAADIHGAHACPKGLRHGFGIACAQKNVNPRLIQRWMGHASFQTTMIYLDASGDEEREFAKRLW